jgi:hypothetical protein
MYEAAIEIDDAVVLLLGAPSHSPQVNGRLEGITRLEKLIFLLERETGIGSLLTESADFTAYHFGPFSPKIYQEVETLAAAGIILDSTTPADTIADSWERFTAIDTIREAPSEDPYVIRNFVLTPRGERYYKAIASHLPQTAIDELAAFKDRFANIPLRKLIKYVYAKYPTFTERSLIKDDILGPPPSYNGIS